MERHGKAVISGGLPVTECVPQPVRGRLVVARIQSRGLRVPVVLRGLGPADSSHPISSHHISSRRISSRRISSHHTSSHFTAKRGLWESGLNGQHAQGKGLSKVVWPPLPHCPCRAVLLHEPHGAHPAGRLLRPAPELVRTHHPSSHHVAPDYQGAGAGRQRGLEQRSEAHHPRARGHGGPPQCSAQRLFWDDNHLPGGPSLALAAQPWVLGPGSWVPGPVCPAPGWAFPRLSGAKPAH